MFSFFFFFFLNLKIIYEYLCYQSFKDVKFLSNKYLFCDIKNMQYLFTVFFFQECQIRTVCQVVLFAKFLKIIVR